MGKDEPVTPLKRTYHYESRLIVSNKNAKHVYHVTLLERHDVLSN